jgi:hypothetical protein
VGQDEKSSGERGWVWNAIDPMGERSTPDAAQRRSGVPFAFAIDFIVVTAIGLCVIGEPDFTTDLERQT